MTTTETTTETTMTTTETTTETIWAVSCPQDPHEERPAHFIAESPESAIQRYADCYRGGKVSGVEAAEADLVSLAEEAAAAGDEKQAADCRLAQMGDLDALTRVCRALG